MCYSILGVAITLLTSKHGGGKKNLRLQISRASGMQRSAAKSSKAQRDDGNWGAGFKAHRQFGFFCQRRSGH